jgi:serine/threonine protein phosphatase PrpC
LPTVSVAISSVSYAGRRRRQEDCYLTRLTPYGAILAIADGMGGHASGDVASRLAIEGIDEVFAAAESSDLPVDVLREGASLANGRIMEWALSHDESHDMGTTLVSAVVRDGSAVVGHVGDSRAWLVTSDDVSLLTRDHTALQDALDRGVVSENEAKGHPYANALIRRLGDDSYPGLDLAAGEEGLSLPPGSILLLTSDGAHGALTPSEILDSLAGTKDLAEGLECLARRAFHSGSSDNITLVGVESGTFQRSQLRTELPPPIPERVHSKPPRRMVVAFVAFLSFVLIVLLLLMIGLSHRDSSGRSGAVKTILE